MRCLLLTVAIAAVISAPAHACRALWEYPAAMEQVAKADMLAEEKKAYQKKLDEGWAVHNRGRMMGDPALMLESVKMLDKIKANLDK
jgi:hypothetical protein